MIILTPSNFSQQTDILGNCKGFQVNSDQRIKSIAFHTFYNLERINHINILAQKILNPAPGL